MRKTKKQPSGAQKRKRRRQQQAAEAARELERIGLGDDWAALLTRLGQPPLDPVGNSEWANNLAAGMAWIIAKDTAIPLEERTKRVAEMIDRISSSQSKALVAKRIREVRGAAGVLPLRPSDGVVPVAPGPSLRTSRRRSDG